PGAPLIGTENLRSFGAHVFEGRPLKLKIIHPKHGREVKFKGVEWPVTRTQITLTLGKGGVGKTTISGGLAYSRRLSHPRENLLIFSTDPAPSLYDFLALAVVAAPAPVLRDNYF